MSAYTSQREKILSGLKVGDLSDTFDELAYDIYLFQYKHNTLYKQFADLISKSPAHVDSVDKIPFLPISFFRKHLIRTGVWTPETIFGSSGTTSGNRSQHLIRDLDFYLQNTIQGFEQFFGNPKQYAIIGYLPGYQERRDSSLIYMVNHLISESNDQQSGFYLGKEQALLEVLQHHKINNIPTILFGVSFALLALSKTKIDFPELIVIETGGMKTSSVDLTKEEIVERLKKAWNLKTIYSEYGMTELLSQSYSMDGKWYKSASTKRVVIGDLSDPFTNAKMHKTGIVKVMDLANLDTCSFVETQDLGMITHDEYFQILGRMDNAELRGCNLLLNDALENPIR
ncbi:long-chain-fatty-acid--protein ligase [Portibacter marinus]|uniref:acyl transferase n=1 Tax=Portibacter marinus TaxID=2898660 RepID=UPI001F30FC8A|nr:acyl transferase [Portibacter marinus]